MLPTDKQIPESRDGTSSVFGVRSFGWVPSVALGALLMSHVPSDKRQGDDVRAESTYGVHPRYGKC